MSDRLYITERTKAWRARDIKPSFVEAIDMIEQHGCQIISVSADDVTPTFSYTTGVYDNCGKPEIIAVGLVQKTAHAALNEAVRRLRGGVDLLQGRHADIIGNVDVEFRPIDPKWLHQVMLRTDWFYERADVPVLQLIYPDLENRFPYEVGFEERFAQPDLSGAATHSRLEDDFWAAHDSESSLSRWKFPAGPHTTSYLSRTVHDKEESITYVSHDFDGDWQFLGDKMSDGGGPVLTCLHHPIDDDPSLEELHDLPLGWYAVRDKPGEPWQRFQKEPEEEDAETVIH